MENNLKQRNGCITAWLWVAIISNIGMAIFYAVSMFSAYSTEMALGFGISSILGLINILGAILLMRWNKTGFYLFLISSIITAIISVFILKMDAATAIGSLIAILIWWAILQAKKDGVSAWSQLETGWDYLHCRHIYQVFSITAIVLFVLTLVAVGQDHNDPYEDILWDYEAVEVDVDTVAAEEVVEVVEVEETVAEKAERFLREAIDEENKSYPQKISEGLTIKKSYIDSDYVMYLVECDEDLMDIDLMNKSKSESRKNLKSSLSSNDPEIKQFLKICIKARKGIGYKYQGDRSGESCVILFPYSELQSF